jgi:hypothetical protein
MAVFIEKQSGELIRDPLKMPLQQLLELDPEIQTLILRQWLRRHEVPAMPEQRLKEFLKQLAEAAVQTRAEIQWEDWMIKHYHLDLWLHRRRPYLACPDRRWCEGMQLELGRMGPFTAAGSACRNPPGLARQGPPAG